MHLFGLFLLCVLFCYSRFHVMEKNPNPDLRNILRIRWGYSPISLRGVSVEVFLGVIVFRKLFAKTFFLFKRISEAELAVEPITHPSHLGCSS